MPERDTEGNEDIHNEDKYLFLAADDLTQLFWIGINENIRMQILFDI